MLDSCIVDENVQLAVARRNILKRGTGNLGIRHVEGHRLRPDLLRRNRELIRVAGVDDDLGAIFHQRLRHGKPQAPGSTRDEGDAALEREHVGHATSSRH